MEITKKEMDQVEISGSMRGLIENLMLCELLPKSHAQTLLEIFLSFPKESLYEGQILFIDKLKDYVGIKKEKIEVHDETMGLHDVPLVDIEDK